MALRLSLFYDILCPRSWVFYQILQKKLPYWRTFRELEINYFPVSNNFLHQKIYGNIHPAGIISRKKDYMLRELYEICDFYGIQKGNFEVTYELDVRRSRLCLLFLNYLRMNKSKYYQKFLEKIWSDFWHNSASFNHTAHFFRVGRELGVPFSEMDDIIMRIDGRTNRYDVSIRLIQLLLEERIIAVPWFRIDSVPGHQKLFAFTEILRLEMLDELIAQPCHNPLNHNIDNPLYLPSEPEKNEENEPANAMVDRKDRLAMLERRWKKKKFTITD